MNYFPDKFFNALFAAFPEHTQKIIKQRLEQRPMTKTTEELKHDMYLKFKELDSHALINEKSWRLCKDFESLMEAYLESLRQEHERLVHVNAATQHHSEILSDAYTHQQGLTHAACTEARETYDQLLESKEIIQRLHDQNEEGYSALTKLRAEHDELRNKLQAFEFANKSAGEFLIAAREKIQRQRQSIGQLKNEKHNIQAAANSYQEKYQKARKELSELRKMVGSTIAQNRKENATGDELKRFEAGVSCSHEFKGLGRFLRCIHCGSTIENFPLGVIKQ